MAYKIHALGIDGKWRTTTATDYQDMLQKLSCVHAEVSCLELIVWDEDLEQCHSRSMFSGDFQLSDKIKWIGFHGYHLKFSQE